MRRIILFDGICHFCDSSVQFIMKRDPKGTFKFASLQSDAARALLQQYHIAEQTDSFILIDEYEQICYAKSTAVLQVCKRLRGWYKLLYAFIIIPRPIRDFCYDQFAKRRYKWFGQKESCTLPSPEQRERFLS